MSACINTIEVGDGWGLDHSCRVRTELHWIVQSAPVRSASVKKINNFIADRSASLVSYCQLYQSFWHRWSFGTPIPRRSSHLTLSFFKNMFLFCLLSHWTELQMDRFPSTRHEPADLKADEAKRKARAESFAESLQRGGSDILFNHFIVEVPVRNMLNGCFQAEKNTLQRSSCQR